MFLFQEIMNMQNRLLNVLNYFLHFTSVAYFRRVMRTPAFCICENKDADQIRCDREADQRLCFRYT